MRQLVAGQLVVAFDHGGVPRDFDDDRIVRTVDRTRFAAQQGHEAAPGHGFGAVRFWSAAREREQRWRHIGDKCPRIDTAPFSESGAGHDEGHTDATFGSEELELVMRRRGGHGPFGADEGPAALLAHAFEVQMVAVHVHPELQARIGVAA